MMIRRLAVFPSALDRRKGHLVAGGMRIACALGRSGTGRRKREGDGLTPCGGFPLRRVWYRADRLPRPETGLPARRTIPDDGWCDAPAHRLYNRPVRLPFPASHERMWRDDALYDIVVEIGWNDRRIRPAKGSAIFMHVARAGFPPTEGCVALARPDLVRLLRRIGPGTRLVIR
jgi:L,D-peptidoglycan transpeptidase YkuD (ErfK/YbiS/YcfS/YnhG family)